LEPGPEVAGLIGRRVLAFAGLALPDKFFTGLARAGVEVVARRPFPDHHTYTETELHTLLADAARLDAVPVTTPKDAVRLPGHVCERVQVIGVTLVWQDEAALNALLASVLAGTVSV
jgi:tetraacyldisaccharide 4'-kinase